jgi:FkbM family methyltransferase
MLSSLRALGQKAADGKLLYSLRDAARYYPRGLNTEVSTPDGVRLSLDGLSPVTVGRYRTGDAEPPERALMPQIPQNRPIVEIGAGVGYISTLMNRRTEEIHLAIEANPTVFPFLERTKELNDADFVPIHAAYHPTNTQVEFPTTRFFKTATFGKSDKNTTSVDARSLDRLLEKYNLDECHLHVDIEGSETLLLNHEMDILVSCCPTVSIEFHRNRIEQPDQYLDRLTDHFEAIAQRGPPDRPVILLEAREPNSD